MAKRQASLAEWCGPAKKGKESSQVATSSLTFQLRDASEPSSSASTVSQSGETGTDGEETDERETPVSNCTALCCANSGKAYQPTHKQILCQLASKGRNFQPQWYKQFTWLTTCTSSKKVYCLYCRYAVQHEMITFIKTGEKAFTQDGFQNWRKAIEKFKAYECSHTHKEAMMKWIARGKPTIATELRE